MKSRRKKFLIHPRIQLLAAVIFTGTGAMGLLLLAVLSHGAVSRVAAQYPDMDPRVLLGLNAELQRNVMIAFLAMIPLNFAAGIAVTFRIVGPLYRFRVFLGEVIRGEKPGPCHVRKQDELQDFCDLLNEATAPLRARQPEECEGEEAADVAARQDGAPSLVGNRGGEAASTPAGPPRSASG